MEGVFQRFDLDEKTIRQIMKELHPGKKMAEILSPKAVATLIQELLDRGYIVFCDNNRLEGIPESIIAGRELPLAGRVKTDFSEITEELGMANWFLSGTSYISIQ